MADNSHFDVSTFIVGFGLVSPMLTDRERYAGHYRELIGLETSRRTTLTPSAGLSLGEDTSISSELRRA
jgi:hypothetical protein